MNRQTALNNALACFHYLLSMYPDSLICFYQWKGRYDVSIQVDLERFSSDYIISDLGDIRLAGSSVDVTELSDKSTVVVHIRFPWGV